MKCSLVKELFWQSNPRFFLGLDELKVGHISLIVHTFPRFIRYRVDSEEFPLRFVGLKVSKLNKETWNNNYTSTINLSL
jgi:hypothetical protein